MSTHMFCGNISMLNRWLALIVVITVPLVYGIIYGFVPISCNCLVPRDVTYDPQPAVRNVVKSSCLRNAFSDIVLVIVYNFPLYSSIPTLSGLYKNAFPTIMFCGGRESKEHNVEWVQSVFRGYFSYTCMSRAMEKYPGYEGYLLIADDLILNYWNLIRMDRNKIWEGPKIPILTRHIQTEKWAWWNSIFGERTCQRAYDDIGILYNSSRAEKLLNMSIISVNGTVHTGDPLWDIKQNRNWTFLCPRGRSDIFYIPRKFADEFKTLSSIFFNYRTFLEIAVPTMCRIIDKEENFEYIPGIYLPRVSDNQSEFLWKTYNTNLAFIHPLKQEYEHDRALNKALLKNWIMEYSNSLSIC